MPITTSHSSDLSFATLSYPLALSDPFAFIHQLREILSSSGFFYLTDIDDAIPGWSATWDTLFAETSKFFALSVEAKEEIGLDRGRHFRGYSGVGRETTRGKKDLREQIDFGPDTDTVVPYPPDATDPRIELQLYGPNLYPSSLLNFRPALTAYRQHCEAISATLISLLAQSLTHDPTLVTSLFADPSPSRPRYTRLKTVCYPPSGEKNGLGVGAHKDGGGLTLLAQDDSGGLEVQDWDGEWKAVKPMPHALVINIGQVIERLSRGAYLAATHRVLPTKTTTPRLSIPFFYCPALETKLTPLAEADLLPEVVAIRDARQGEVSEVAAGDLHEEVFGRSAWRGNTRSQPETWRKWYGEWDTVGGPERVAKA